MPVFINEVITEVAPSVVPQATQQPAQAATPLAQSEYELVQTLSVLSERQARLQFD